MERKQGYYTAKLKHSNEEVIVEFSNDNKFYICGEGDGFTQEIFYNISLEPIQIWQIAQYEAIIADLERRLVSASKDNAKLIGKITQLQSENEPTANPIVYEPSTHGLVADLRNKLGAFWNLSTMVDKEIPAAVNGIMEIIKSDAKTAEATKPVIEEILKQMEKCTSLVPLTDAQIQEKALVEYPTITIGTAFWRFDSSNAYIRGYKNCMEDNSGYTEIHMRACWDKAIQSIKDEQRGEYAPTFEEYIKYNIK